MQYTLLARGAGFCTDPSFADTVQKWEATLEAAMAYHRSSTAFDEMRTAHFRQLCTLDDAELYPSTHPGQYAEIYDAAVEQVGTLMGTIVQL